MQAFDKIPPRISDRGDAIPVKIKDGCRRPYLLTDRNHFWACITIPLGEHLGRVSKKSDQWSRRRCDNETVTVLSKGQIAILKMAAIRPYLLTDWNRFWADTSRHREIPAVVSEEMRS